MAHNKHIADIKQLRHILQLLDDESPVVRDSILKELERFGSSLEQEITRLEVPPTEEQLKLLQHLLADQHRKWLQETWSEWFHLKEDKEQLEEALRLLSEYLNGRHSRSRLSPLLDALAQDYRTERRKRDPLDLANYLFKLRGISGASQEDYYDPMNSDLVHVIEKRRGIPISLACIYILVGHRLGLAIEGCNFPGHFLALASTKRERVIVDCYNGGRYIDQKHLANINASISIEDIERLECQAPTIIARVLRNLINAYQHSDDTENTQLMLSLLRTIDQEPGEEV